MEQDPNGMDAHAPGAKLDAGKVRPDLILDGMARALLAVAEVATYGAEKYTENGWMHVPDALKRYNAAKDRHRLRGAFERCDPDTGLLHAAHEAWNALAKLELMMRDDVRMEVGSYEPYADTHLDLRMDTIARNGNDGEHYAEDMTDPANWRAGDLVECYKDAGSLEAGSIFTVQVDPYDGMNCIIDPDGDACVLESDYLRFHSRPSTDWIEWNGGECPCDELSEVQVQTRDGEYAARAAGSFMWRHYTDQDDIIRYRML